MAGQYVCVHAHDGGGDITQPAHCAMAGVIVVCTPDGVMYHDVRSDDASCDASF